MPRPGDVVHVSGRASVQFTAVPAFLLRIIHVRVLGSTPYGWAWIDGYVLNEHGDACDRREVFVDVAGLRAVGKAPDPRTRNTRSRTASTGSARVPQQRTPARTPARSTR